MSSKTALNNNDLLIYHVADRLQQNTPDSDVIQEIQKRGATEKEAISIFGEGVKYTLQKSKSEAYSNLIWGITSLLIGAVALYIMIWAVAWQLGIHQQMAEMRNSMGGPPPGAPRPPTLIFGLPQPLFVMAFIVGIECVAVIFYGITKLIKSWLNFRWLRLRSNMTQFELK